MQIKKPFLKYTQSIAKTYASQRRDTRYVFVALFSALLLVLTTLQALSNGLFDSIERPVFESINNLPNMLHNFMYAATQLGGLGALILWVGAGWYLINRRAALTVLAGGTAAWFLAKVLKAYVGRGRPGDVLDTTLLLSNELFGGFGFPSGHATFSAACAAILYYQVKPRYRKYLLLIVVLVGFSRMYLGAHFPLDIVGGWALGAFVGAFISLIVGVSTKPLAASQVKRIMNRKGYDITHLKFADVDARGSRPVFMTTADGTEYFAKIFGKQEHAADWLFKIYRFFRYKNLQAEEPYMNSRRNIELEAFATLWAAKSGVRTAAIIDVIQAGSLWILIQEKVKAVPLSEHSRILSKSLEEAWRQVSLMHSANMAHRDMRAANLMIDTQGRVWVIDFGFAEIAPRAQRKSMDIAELLMSMSLVTGTKRTLDAALKVMEHDQLERAMPYLQKAVFSGATAKQLKQNKDHLQDMKSQLARRLEISDEIEKVDIIRINAKKIVNIVLLAIFIYLIIPQFKQFAGILDALGGINPIWFILIALASAATYVLTGLIYVILSDVPLKLRVSTLVQLAASFVSKIVPGGLGSASMNARYLTKSGVNVSEASALLTAQGIIGFVMFIVPLTIFMVLNGRGISELLSFQINPRVIGIALAVVLAAAAIIVSVKKYRHKVAEITSKYITDVRDLSSSGINLGYAALTSFGVTLSYMLCLYAATQAFGLNLGISSIVLIYASAVIVKSAIPTPGGLGPLEIAMVSSMIGLGVARPEALSVVILYRLATFWLPIPFSLLAYRYITNEKII